jgi:hypothetical protein
MTDYKKLVEALRCKRDDCEGCDLAFLDNDEGWMCQYAAKDDDAADAIEALQAEVQSYKALADEWQASAGSKERLLGLYRAEQVKHFYSATDDNGRIIKNQCASMNIPVFPDSSESPNS